MATSKSSKQITKASFVRSLPASLSAADVVKKAKDAGISLTDKHVWAIRSESRTKKAKKAGPAKKATTTTAGTAATKTAAPAKAGGAVKSKAGFVRSLPHSMSAKEVVAKGKAAGVKLSDAYVYAIRSAAKKSGKSAAAKKAGSSAHTSRPAAASTSLRSGSSSETSFRKLVMVLGIDRAKDLVADVAKKIEALIAGT